MGRKIDRREFIKSTAAGTVAAGLALSGGSAHARILGANNRLRVGVIGAGRMGQTNLADFNRQDDAEVVAIADVYGPNLERGAHIAGLAEKPGGAPKVDKYDDFRRVLDRRDIDAVIVATPDHWHALGTVMACEAGKDVYVEKPIATTVYEGREMVEAARKYNRVVQVGTQQRSGVVFQKAVELVQSGRIGKVSYVRTWNFGNEYPDGIGRPADSAPPPELNWDMWLGPAPRVPFNENRFGVKPDRWSTFRWFWDYAGGMMTDWGVHLMDIVQWAMKVDFPKTVSAAGGKLCIQDNRETPDTLQAVFEYPEFICTYENRVCNGNGIHDQGYGIMFHGTEGSLYVNREFYEVIPEKKIGAGGAKEDRTEPIRQQAPNQQHITHVRNFVDSVKSRAKPVSDIEIGHRSTTTCLLANVALRSGQRLVWDGSNQRIVSGGEASRFLTRVYRRPWELKVERA